MSEWNQGQPNDGRTHWYGQMPPPSPPPSPPLPYSPESPQPEKRKRGRKVAAVSAVVGLVGAGVGIGVVASRGSGNNNEAAGLPKEPGASAPETPGPTAAPTETAPTHSPEMLLATGELTEQDMSKFVNVGSETLADIANKYPGGYKPSEIYQFVDKYNPENFNRDNAVPGMLVPLSDPVFVGELYREIYKGNKKLWNNPETEGLIGDSPSVPIERIKEADPADLPEIWSELYPYADDRINQAFVAQLRAGNTDESLIDQFANYDGATYMPSPLGVSGASRAEFIKERRDYYGQLRWEYLHDREAFEQKSEPVQINYSNVELMAAWRQELGTDTRDSSPEPNETGAIVYIMHLEGEYTEGKSHQHSADFDRLELGVLISSPNEPDSVQAITIDDATKYFYR